MTRFERIQKMDIHDFAIMVEANGCERCPLYKGCRVRDYDECIEDIVEYYEGEEDDESTI